MSLFGGLWDTVQDAVDAGAGAVSTAVDTVASSLKGFARICVKVFNDVRETILGIPSAIVDNWNSSVGTAVTRLRGQIMAMYTPFGARLKGVWQGTMMIGGRVISNLRGLASYVADSLPDLSANVLSKISDWALGLPSAVLAKLKELLELPVTAVLEGFKSVLNGK